jgi:rhodanese-related sulfurtransferase
MKRAILLGSALTLAAGLVAYGVSPSQYNQGRAQDGGNSGIPQAPQPQPVPMNAMGQPQMQIQPGGQELTSAPVPDWAKEWKHYDWDQALKAWETREGLFIDARGKMEYEQGHIPGAISLPMGDFDANYEKYKGKIKAAKVLIPYCSGINCQLSNKVAQKLWQEKGHRNVANFFGGWPKWQQHNMPVESGPEPKR